jgi:hypothetical protein
MPRGTKGGHGRPREATGDAEANGRPRGTTGGQRRPSKQASKRRTTGCHKRPREATVSHGMPRGTTRSSPDIGQGSYTHNKTGKSPIRYRCLGNTKRHKTTQNDTKRQKSTKHDTAQHNAPQDYTCEAKHATKHHKPSQNVTKRHKTTKCACHETTQNDTERHKTSQNVTKRH